ncbi:MAG TPA: hypothetical protein PKE54_08605, partial [Candidatus Obscuribacter sp.]|nr:hypothetical protein [Candidatus Obscuribacter sp.]
APENNTITEMNRQRPFSSRFLAILSRCHKRATNSQASHFQTNRHWQTTANRVAIGKDGTSPKITIRHALLRSWQSLTQISGTSTASLFRLREGHRLQAGKGNQQTLLYFPLPVPKT